MKMRVYRFARILAV